MLGNSPAVQCCASISGNPGSTPGLGTKIQHAPRHGQKQKKINLFFLSVFIVYGEGNGNPLQYSCLENSMDLEPGSQQSMGSQRVGHD